MRAVIFAAALLVGATGWLLLETDSQALIQTTAADAGVSSLRSAYRAETAECRRQEKPARAACERKARDRVLTEVKTEAARLSLR